MSLRAKHISCLPVEVLCTIFAFVSQSSCGTDYARKLHLISHVCRTWREASLNFSCLWADVVCAFASPFVTNILFARARNMPIAFIRKDVFTEKHTLTSCQLAMAVKHISRARILAHQDVVHKYDWPDLLCARTLPVLQELTVSMRRPVTIDIFYEQSPLTAPSLHKLSLRHMLFPIHAPSLRCLELTADKQLILHPYSIPATRLLSLLKSTPLLEEFVLSHVAVLADLAIGTEENSTANKVELPYLKKLCYTDIDFNHDFWERIRVPSEVDVHIELQYRNDDTVVPRICTAMQQQISAPCYTTVRLRAFISCIGPGLALSIALRRDHDEYDTFRAIQEPAFEVTFHAFTPQHAYGGYDLFKVIAPYIQLSNIRCLEIGQPVCDTEFETPVLRSALMPYSSVDTVRVTMNNLLVADILDERRVRNEDAAKVVLPALRRFRVDGTHARFLDPLDKSMDAVRKILDDRAARLGTHTELSTFSIPPRHKP